MRPRDGFATIWTLVLLGLVATVTTALVRGSAARARRVRHEIVRAQLQQDLLAATTSVSRLLAGVTGSSTSLPDKPMEIPGDGGTVVIRTVNQTATEFRCRLTAESAGELLTEELLYNRNPHGWRLADVVGP